MEVTADEFFRNIANEEGVTFKGAPHDETTPGFHAIDGDGNVMGGGYRQDDTYAFWLK